MSGIKILREPQDVFRYLDEVTTFADEHRDEFGFTPKSAYLGQAAKRRLWVAVDQESSSYLGHLLIGGTFPTLRVFQIFAKPEQQRRGVGSTLIESLVAFGQRNGWISIQARVANDLGRANEFWSRMKFRAVQIKPGGKTRGREIIVRERIIPGNSLFSEAEITTNSASDILKANKHRASSELQLGIDLNVLFDLLKNRENGDQIAKLVGLSMAGQVSLYLTAETKVELVRQSGQFGHDPVLQLVNNMAVLPAVSNDAQGKLVEELRKIIFPDRLRHGSRSAQNESDLKHIASCVHHRLTGFLTGEGALLLKAQDVRERFGIDILSPMDVLPDFEPVQSSALTFQSFQIREMSESDRSLVQNFLSGRGVPPIAAGEILRAGTEQNPRRRLLLLNSGTVFGIVSWQRELKGKRNIDSYLIIDELAHGSLRFVEHAIERLLRDTSTFVARQITARIGIGQSETQRLLQAVGYNQCAQFEEASGLQAFQKVAFSGIITPEKWDLFCEQMKGLSDVSFDRPMPTYEGARRDGVGYVSSYGARKLINLLDLESYLSCVLLLFSGRKGWVVPIVPEFAEALLGPQTLQLSFLEGHESSLRIERTYFRAARGASKVHVGDPVIFYGLGAIKKAIGCGRVVRSEVVSIDAIGLVREQGVVTDKQLQEIAGASGKVHAISFTGFQEFETKISYKKLEAMKVPKANFVTIQRIEPQVFRELCLLGLGEKA